jgi:hypothetical protein
VDVSTGSSKLVISGMAPRARLAMYKVSQVDRDKKILLARVTHQLNRLVPVQDSCI